MFARIALQQNDSARAAKVAQMPRIALPLAS
jgi:hypothetical protein